MKEIGIEELKILQLDMMKDIHAFCKEHDIKYSLAFGSLLGAVRHKGYIPWDDDLDIMIPREDYDRFVSEYGSDKYGVTDLNKNPNHGLAFAKVEDLRTILKEEIEGDTQFGVFIDVFPVDHVPDNLARRKCYFRRKAFWNALFNLKLIKIREGRSLIKNIVLAIGHVLLLPVPRKYIVNKMAYITSLYRGTKTEYMGIVAPADSRIREAVPSSDFDEYISVPFEDTEFMIIKEYDAYLKGAYGDYMKLPPAEKQIAHHAFKAFWK